MLRNGVILLHLSIVQIPRAKTTQIDMDHSDTVPLYFYRHVEKSIRK